jgi:hypothetical protein
VLAFFVRFVSNGVAVNEKIALTTLAFAFAEAVSAQNRASDCQLARIVRDLISP